MAYVPISKELHGDKSWVRHSSLLFAKADTVAPLLVGDLAAVIPPFLALARNRGQAARANFCLGVMPPRAIFGLS